jgi:superfamily II DNA or RNA helicase
MLFTKRDPRAGYLDNWLWLPKAFTSELQIRSALTYVNERKNVAVHAWQDEPDHFKVPRNYFTAGTLHQLPYPVYDARFVEFPHVDIRSRVELDSRNPSRTYQREGSAALLEAHDGILCLRCGAGKTAVGLHTVAQSQQPVLIVVTDKGLAEQWTREIVKFTNVTEDDIGRVGGDGSRFDWEHPITVALVQTLAQRVAEGKLPTEMTRHFGEIILDEAHLMGAPHFNTAIPPFHGRRRGLSATPEREDGFDSLLRYTLGPVVYTYLKPDLIPTVCFKRLLTHLNLSDPKVVRETHDVTRNLHLGMLYGYLATREDRTALICEDINGALNAGRQLLVLTHSRAMVEQLALRFPNAGVVHADIKSKERDRRIRECNPIISIIQLGKHALDKESLDTLFLCEPLTKAGTVQQIMGRILRDFDGKKPPMFIIFEDVHIQPMHYMCNKIRRILSRWPEHKGGAIPYKVIKP